MNPMKSFFKILIRVFFIIIFSIGGSFFVQGRDIIVVTYDSFYNKAHLIEKTLLNELKIPKDLILLRRIPSPCERIEEAIFHICIDRRGEIKFPKIRAKVLLNSFSIFRNGRKN